MSQESLKGTPSNAFDDDAFTDIDLSLPLGPLPIEPAGPPPQGLGYVLNSGHDAQIEKLFSICKTELSDQRNRLQIDCFETIECLVIREISSHLARGNYLECG